MKYLVVKVGVIVLLVACCLIAGVSISRSKRIVMTPLADCRNREYRSTQVEELQLGDESVSRMTKALLRYDDNMFVRYKTPTVEFDVFAAFWRSGGNVIREIDLHNPTTCWPQSGWKLIKESRYSLSGATSKLDFDPIIWTFERDGRNVVVLFWRTSGANFVPIRRGSYFGAWFESLVVAWRSGGEPQVMIRFSSEASIERLLQEPVFISVVRDIRRLTTL